MNHMHVSNRLIHQPYKVLVLLLSCSRVLFRLLLIHLITLHPGQLIVASLLSRNIRLRLILRDPEKASALFGKQDEEQLQVVPLFNVTIIQTSFSSFVSYIITFPLKNKKKTWRYFSFLIFYGNAFI